MVEERKGVVEFVGQPVTLLGPDVSVGQEAPDFTAVNQDLSTFKFGDTSGVRVISVVPSLDTGVCSIQTRTFNERVADLDGVNLITVSMDLPFAQKRWCGDEGLEDAVTISDYRDRDFGTSYGTLMKEFGLLSRSVFVVDSTGKIVYKEQLANSAGPEPDYDAALEAAANAS